MDDGPLMELDALSRGIIVALQDDGRASFREIGMRLGVAPNTVRARYRLLQEQGIIDVIAVPNHWKMGLTCHATIGLKLRPGYAEQAIAVLQARREVAWVGRLLNGYDVLLEVAATDALTFVRLKEELFTAIEGFVDADVFMMSDVRKFRYRIEIGDA
ncbi:AsnC family transcriptional regulator [Acidisoma cellulosilytica]|uniref:AsnC family transcriptional regulator n=1 Tax=Acidisoma cellulosilyticum TaxID=2802395 RepID=A0A963Z6Y3_9PROT|nr:AsnC family transcriptional regulator [Acidisoma cellulosilyticum]MCB8883701.1 AsnC family transcriptional regulator [Acidisoma cellulosilyticum]